MSLTPGPWKRLSDPAKFRLYTRLTAEGAVAFFGAVGWFSSHDVAVAVATTATAAAGIAALEARPELVPERSRAVRTGLTIGAALTFVAVWIICAVFAGQDGRPLGIHEASTLPALGWFVVLVAALSLFTFSRYRWLLLIAATAATALVFYPEAPLERGVVILVAGAAMMYTTRMTIWALRIVDDLDRAREVEAELHVAEERLRFARDLHDVVGRGFSAIAVKSELAARLVRSPADGAVERAALEMDEVKALAVESMEGMRALVRGYRGVDLASEVAGARSLLDAAGCQLAVEGSPDAVPADYLETAAWVVREGATNIVRHSTATSAVLTLGQSGMALTNNGLGARSDTSLGSGLGGLTERLGAIDGNLRTWVNDGEFTLEVHWKAP